MTFREIVVLDTLANCLTTARDLLVIAKKRRRRFEDFLVKMKAMENDFASIADNLPEDKTTKERVAGFWRHLWFVERFLGTDRHHLVVHNLNDIVALDIPSIIEEFKSAIRRSPTVHPQFHNECKNLIATGEYDSAIRKGFVLIREIAKVAFPKIVTDRLDGQALMRALFSPGHGPIQVHKERDKQEGFLAWACSLYALFRNDEMHNLRGRPLHEIECILMSINRLLFAIDPAGTVALPKVA